MRRVVQLLTLRCGCPSFVWNARDLCPPPRRPVAGRPPRLIFQPHLSAAGHLPVEASGTLITGKVGSELTTEQGYDAARVVGLNILATLKGECAARGGGQPPSLGDDSPPTRRVVAPRATSLTPAPPRPAAELGDLDKVKKIVKLTAFVNCVDGFQSQPKVVNGCSDLLATVFGDKGKHARSAVGVNGLPLNVPVEVEAIVEVEDS